MELCRQCSERRATVGPVTGPLVYCEPCAHSRGMHPDGRRVPLPVQPEGGNDRSENTDTAPPHDGLEHGG